MDLGIFALWDVISYSEGELSKEPASLLLQAPYPSPLSAVLVASAQKVRSSPCLFLVQHFYSSRYLLNSQLLPCNFLCQQHCHAVPYQKWENT